MARGITQSQVDIAADALLQRGERPTIEKVRSELGTGSPNTLTRLLEVWWAGLSERLAAQARAYIENPFENEGELDQAGRAIGRRRHEITLAITALLDAGKSKEACRLILALGCYQVRCLEPTLLDESLLPEVLFRGLGFDMIAGSKNFGQAVIISCTPGAIS